MSNDPQKPYSLDDDRTFAGQENEAARVSKKLGMEETRGDAGDSSEDEFQQVLDAFDEVIELEKRYDTQGELGAGGMGTVLKAVDKRLGRTVALKFLLKELGNSAQALRRFMTEAKAIATLNHNNIVQIYEMERSAEGPYIVMEYVEGGSLVDLLKGGPLELDNAVDIICQVCDGLSAAHDQGITHRDIKPANILITTTGIPKLSDFGLARQSAEDHGQTKVGAVLGTIDFMSPEQRRDATDVDARSDLWSLGATFYQMITGSSPRVIRLDQLPANLAPVIGKMLEENPADRYQTAADFQKATKEAMAKPVERQSRENEGDEDTRQGKVAFNLSPGGQRVEPNVCPSCSSTIPSNAKFCLACGTALQSRCPDCGATHPVHSQFCMDCGADMSGLQREGQDADDHSNRPLADGNQGEPDKAIEECDRAIRLNPEDAVVDQMSKTKANLEEELVAAIASAEKTTVTLKGHSGYVRSVSFSPDGRRIVSGSEDKTVKVWNAETGQ